MSQHLVFISFVLQLLGPRQLADSCLFVFIILIFDHNIIKKMGYETVSLQFYFDFFSVKSKLHDLLSDLSHWFLQQKRYFILHG